MRELKPANGRKCYDHLGGKLGEVLFDYLINNDYIVLDEGKTTVYKLTQRGEDFFKKNGIEI